MSIFRYIIQIFVGFFLFIIVRQVAIMVLPATVLSTMTSIIMLVVAIIIFQKIGKLLLPKLSLPKAPKERRRVKFGRSGRPRIDALAADLARRQQETSHEK